MTEAHSHRHGLTHLLDTSIYCQPLKPRPLSSVEGRWRALGDDALATSVICEAEVLYGIELKQSTRLLVLYDKLLRNKLTVLPVDAAVAKSFAAIKATARKQGFSASDFDFLIAATAKTHGLTVATLNIRHFNGIQGVAVEDWS